jgi:hypothetical protein
MVVQKHLFLDLQKDTPNTTEDRDMPVRYAARFLIHSPAFPLRTVLPVADCSLPTVCVVLALYHLSPRNEGSAFVPEPNWEDGDFSHASRMQRVGGEVL